MFWPRCAGTKSIKQLSETFMDAGSTFFMFSIYRQIYRQLLRPRVRESLLLIYVATFVVVYKLEMAPCPFLMESDEN
jgi:hypothetical protein